MAAAARAVRAARAAALWKRRYQRCCVGRAPFAKVDLRTRDTCGAASANVDSAGVHTWAAQVRTSRALLLRELADVNNLSLHPRWHRCQYARKRRPPLARGVTCTHISCNSTQTCFAPLFLSGLSMEGATWNTVEGAPWEMPLSSWGSGPRAGNWQRCTSTARPSLMVRRGIHACMRRAGYALAPEIPRGP